MSDAHVVDGLDHPTSPGTPTAGEFRAWLAYPLAPSLASWLASSVVEERASASVSKPPDEEVT